MKTSLYVLTLLSLAIESASAFSIASRRPPSRLHYSDDQSADLPSFRREWNARSLNYYSKVLRVEQVDPSATPLAHKHYVAICKVRDGQWDQAESIYRRTIQQLQKEDCDHGKLATTTLLLALLLNRSGDAKKTRAVFVKFLRVVDPTEQCACSAKVLQAYALFEMKQGNAMKSLELVEKAVQLDPALEPVLHWKQFRDASARKSSRR